MPGPKKAQRTKGNVKPSSSSQAALLLAASGQAATGFIGFSNQPAFVPASETFDDSDSTLDDDFRLVLRKLSKRDSVTKIKALHEFITLCNSKGEECVKAVVPFWPRVYNKVAIDTDHKVRELSQKALATLAALAGKAIAPHLKSIMGVWMVSMCDTYPTVASAANSAFTSTFPPAKQTEAARFCKVEVTETLMSNILQQSPQTLSDPLTTSEEDMEAKYQRVVSSSLQAFSKLLHMLPADCISDSMSASLTKLLESPTFWKHSKSTVPQIKCGVLSLLSTVCQLCPDASNQVISKMAPFIFSCLDSADPNVVACTWEAVLSLVSAHEDCWQHVNWQKAVWPKIKQVLENGCFGQAGVICPCLLPLLSKIPKINFNHFFESFRQGLKEDSSCISPSDLSALTRSFLECIQFAVKRISDTQEDASAEITNLIHDQVLVIVQASLTEPKSGLCRTDLYVRLCPLLASVARTDINIEDHFWSELSSFIRSRLLDEFVSADKSCQESEGINNNKPVIFQRLKLLLEGLVFQQKAFFIKTERIRFTTEDDQPKHRQNNFDKEKQNLSNSAEKFIGDIFVTLFTIISLKEQTAPLFFNVFKDLSMIHIANHIAERLCDKNDIVVELVTRELGLKLMADFLNCVEVDFIQSSLVNVSGERIDKFREFLCDHLAKFLMYVQMKEKLNSSASGQFGENVILTIFAFVAYTEQENGTKILFSILNNLTEPRITCQFIEHLLGFVKFIPACQPLVEGTELAGKIEKLTVSVTAGENVGEDGERRDNTASAVWKMLTSVVSSLDETDNHLFSQSCLDAIMSSCLATLKQLQSPDLNQKADTVSSVFDLVLALFRKHKVSMHPRLGELVLSLLPLLLKAQLTEGESQRKLKLSWLGGLRLILQKKSDVEIRQFVQHFSTIVKEFIRVNVHTQDSLLSLGKVVRMTIKTVARPSGTDETDDSDDESTESCSKRDRNEDDDLDVETLTFALDNMLMTDLVEVDCMKEIHDYLYIVGYIESMPQSFQSNETCQAQSYLVRAVHNMNILRLSTELLDDKTLETDTQNICHQWSDIQLSALAEMCYMLCVLEASRKIKPQAFKEYSEPLLMDLQNELVKCFKDLNMEQLSFIINCAVQRPGETYPVSRCGVKAVLERAPRSEQEEVKMVSSFVISALFSLRTSFLTRCLNSESLMGEVTDVLNKSEVTGPSICEAFALTSSVILTCEDLNLRHLAECISGFMSLAKDYGVLNDEVKLSLFQQITVIVAQLKDKQIHLLSGSDKSAVSEDHFHLNISIIRALKLLVVPCNEHFWEFTLCALVEWIQFLSEVKLIKTAEAVYKALTVSTCQLAHVAAYTFSTAPVATEEIPNSSFCVTLKAKTEWDELFSDGVFSLLLPLFVSLASSATTSDDPLWSVVMLSLASAVSLCPSRLVLAHHLPARLTATDKSNMPDSLKTVLNHLCPLLLSRQRCVEVASYKLISSIVDEIPKYEASNEEEEKQEEEVRSPPEAIIQHVESAGHFLECLKVVQVEDHIEMDRGTEERAQSMGYLLGWRLLLQLFRCSPNQLRAKYAQYFKASDSVSRLLDILFRLMPAHPSPSMLEFTSDLSVEDENEAELSSLALYVYRQCLEILPALVRTWWVNQDRKSSNFVDKFTTQYLSNSLIWQQTTSAQNDNNNISGITIRARPAAREVSATYEMAEVTVNMCITLPENYPLGKLEVACDKRVGVSQAQWDRWLLQLNIFLQHQNGSIVEGLRLWKGNIDKKFEGVEDCMICFSVIHGTTFQLPRLTCKTCRKKFHSACLYKWFNTAQKSSCPLCRNLF